MTSEFELISRYFTQNHPDHPEIIQGIGDDAAIWHTGPGHWVTAVDTLVSGVHFFPDCHPADLAHKALAVNLSDIAAMGATPRWFTLALTLPDAQDSWLQAFSDSLFTQAKQHHVALIGGDTTQGPLSVTIQVMGTSDQNNPLLRSGAKIGDDIYVSGTLGDAGLALRYLKKQIDLPDVQAAQVLQKFHRPQARLALGQALVGVAHAAIDISDGLAQDLNHILQASQAGAQVYVEGLPVSDVIAKHLTAQQAQQLALTAGDDYELCFTAPKDQQHTLQALAEKLAIPLTRIGEVTAQPGIQWINQNGDLVTFDSHGWQHFV